MHHRTSSAAGLVAILFIVSIVLIGWVMNVVKLSNCNFEAPYKCEVIHAVGIIPPVGMITGWLNIDD